MNTLLPIVQASQLLQARKTDEDVNTICEMCDKMNANQVSKVLQFLKNKCNYNSPGKKYVFFQFQLYQFVQLLI